MINVVFMGTPDYATTILSTLLKDEKINIQAVFTQPDKPVGRKQVLTPPHVKQHLLHENLDIPIYQPIKLNSDENFEIIKKLKPDFVIVAAYGQIISKQILELSTFINLHASILPKYRGASPIQDSLLRGDRYTGVTAMLMDVGLDSGDILGYSYLSILPTLEVAELFEQLSLAAAKLTVDVLHRFHTIMPVRQAGAISSKCSKIKKIDGIISFEDATNIYNRYRAFKYWPGIFLESGLALKEIELHENSNHNSVAGKISEIEKEYIIVECKIGSLKVKRVQAKSKNEVSVADYIRGKRLEIGDCLS